MRLAVWNAATGFHDKLPVLLEMLRPDVAVISECANEAELTRRVRTNPSPWSSMLWAGRNQHKGIGLFTFGDYRLASPPISGPTLEWVIPAVVTGPTSFNLLGVWAMNHRARNNTGPGSWPQPAVALETYDLHEPMIMAGDFNHSVVWDRPGTPEKNHARNLLATEQHRLVSAYHRWFTEDQGAELRPTFFRRGLAAHLPAHHIDYAFIPEAWTSRLREVTVGSAADWVLTTPSLSDHVPLIVDIADG